MGSLRLFRIAIVVTLALFLAAWAAVPLPRQVRVGAIDIGWLTAALLAAGAAVWASRQPENAPVRRSFRFFAAGAFVWASGQVVWTYQELVQELDSPVFQVADVAYWCSLLFLAAGIFTWPRERRRWTSTTVLEVALVAGFAALFGFEFVLDPLLELEGGPLMYLFVAMYPPGEVLLFGLAVSAIMLNGWHDRRRLELIALALLAIVVGDAGYTYLGETYSTGSFLDPLWTLGFLGVATAAASPHWRGRPGFVGPRGRAFAPAGALILLAVLGIVLHSVNGAALSVAELLALLGLVLLLAVAQGHAQVRLREQIEEHRSLEQQLQHAQKLEAVGRLAGGVAHDFNNLLTAIDGYSELAYQGLAPGHPVRVDIDEVRRAARRAAELTRQLLAFSRRQVLAPQVVDLNAVIADAESLLRRLAGDVTLEIRPAPRPAFVLADPGQLEQVITNLVVNARDAIDGAGTVTLATWVDGGRVGLSVADTGAGMTGEIQARIFEPFFTTKETGKGTGLGLAMVHGILAQSNGEISVVSVPGEGTTFTVELPAADDPAGVAAGAVETRPAAGCERVLLVEDEAAVRELARRMLEAAGYEVVPAASGEEALELIGLAGAVDVLVTDVVMPGMSGHELADELRRECPGLAVVLMSGYSQDSEALDRLRAAGAAFVEKPFTSSALVSEVRGVLDAALPLPR